MAAKKKRPKGKGKRVTITIDAETIERLLAAAEAIAKLAAATITHVDDPALKKRLTKRAKRR